MSSKFTPCGKCENGYITKKDELGHSVVTECECHRKWLASNRLEKTYRHNGFDMRHFDFTPEMYVGEESRKDKDRLVNYVTQFEKNEAVRQLVVYLYGPNGTQKTTFASWIGRSLLEKGFSVRYFLMNDLVKLMMDADDFNEEKATKAKGLLEKLEETDLIIIDEAFDKEKIKLWKSGYQLSYVDSWIRHRVQSLNKGLFFISNVPMSKIESNGFSHSIQDFIQREVSLHKCELSFLDNYLKSQVVEFDGSLF